MTPVERLSRIAAQLAPLRMVDSIPYFLKSPFSWAMTMGEQSVKAMMPKVNFEVSGPSLAYAAPTQCLGKPARSAANDIRRLALARNLRLESLFGDDPQFGLKFICLRRRVGDPKLKRLTKQIGAKYAPSQSGC